MRPLHPAQGSFVEEPDWLPSAQVPEVASLMLLEGNSKSSGLKGCLLTV